MSDVPGQPMQQREQIETHVKENKALHDKNDPQPKPGDIQDAKQEAGREVSFSGP